MGSHSGTESVYGVFHSGWMENLPFDGAQGVEEGGSGTLLILGRVDI